MKFFKNKESKQIFLSAILIVILIALYIEINVLIGKINIPVADITEEKVYSLSDKTKKYISNIQKEVNIKMVDFDEYPDYIYSIEVEDLLNQYAKENDKIKLSKETDNSADNKYPYVVFNCEGREYSVSLDELYSFKYNVFNGTQEERLICESVVSNVINTITTDKQDKVYIYLEKSFYNEKMLVSLINRINGLGIDASSLNLSSDKKIPEDCKIVVIPPLATTNENGEIVVNDLSNQEKDEFAKYINNGGNILFLQESKSIAAGETPNLDYIMSLYGLSISDGFVLEKTNKIDDNPGYIYPQVDDKMLKSGAKVCLFDAGKINLASDEELEKLNVKQNVLMKASNEAFIRNNVQDTSLDRSENDEDGAGAVVGVYAEKRIGDNVSKAIVYSNSLFALNSPVYINETYRNKKIALEMILMDDNEEIIADSLINLLDDDNITYNKKIRSEVVPAVGILKDGITLKVIFIIPIIVLIIGYAVWRYRKNKK